MASPLFPKEDVPALKAWIVKRLENTSDADADVLGEYVIELLRHDGDAKSIRELCKQEIRDFLNDNDSSVFIDDVFTAISDKLYLPPEARPPKPSTKPAPSYDSNKSLDGFIPKKPQAPGPNNSAGPPLNGSRKRPYREQENGDGQDAPENTNRVMKQARRGYDGDRGGGGTDVSSAWANPGMAMGYNSSDNPLALVSGFPGFPRGPDGLPFPSPFMYPGQGRGGAKGGNKRGRKQRCRQFDTQGFCPRGLTCPHDHSLPDFPAASLPLSLGINAAYDPSDPNLLLFAAQQQLRNFAPPNIKGPPKKRRGDKPRKASREKGSRAPFSVEGPVQDKNRTTIVVEGIPEENFTEGEIREFFGQFGQITEATLKQYKHLAIIKFDSWDSANAAYQCPKAIFDNRFVKVFWHKDEAEGSNKGRRRPDSTGLDPDAHPSDPTFDMDDFIRRQEEAQRAFEEKRQRRTELLKQKEELDKRQQDLLERQLEVKRKLEVRLGTASGGASRGEEEGSAATESLRAQLMKLEEEARILGLDPNSEGALFDEGSSFAPRGGYRGRGGARGSFRGRGSGPRGGFRGGYGGGYGDVHEAYAAYSLDNRPKRVSVTGIDFTVPQKDEALRQFLLGIGEFTAVETTPSTTHVTFKDRKTAEMFFVQVNNNTLPGVEGTLEAAWIPNATPRLRPDQVPQEVAGTRTQAGSAPAIGGDGSHSADEAGSEDGEVVEDEDEGRGYRHEDERDMDYEVADDDEWGS